MKNILNFRGFFLVFFQKILLAVLNKTAQTIEMVIYRSEPFRVKKSHVIEEKLKPSKNFFFLLLYLLFSPLYQAMQSILTSPNEEKLQHYFLQTIQISTLCKSRPAQWACCVMQKLHNRHAAQGGNYTTDVVVRCWN